MDTLYQTVFLGKREMQAIKNDVQLHFETVLIPDGGFERMYPELSSSSGINSFESCDVYNLPDNECNGSSIRDSSEEVPSHDFLTNEIQEESNTPIPISKKKIKVLEVQQRETYLKDTLSRINGVICGMKKVVSNNVRSDHCKLKKHIGTVINSPVSKNLKGTQKILLQSSEVTRSPKRGQNLNKPLNVLHSSDKSKECNIDFLKGCIIEASRTLIKTEKSLRVFGKLLHGEVLIEKQAAVKHLKHFQYTVNTFRKTVNGIDKSLLTHYRHLIPNINSEPVCESESKKVNLDSQKNEDNIIDYESLLNGDKQFEIIIPAVATKQIREISESSTGDQNGISSLNISYPNPVSVQSETKKRRKSIGDGPSSKKIKTKIVDHNWSSLLENNVVEGNSLYVNKKIQSNGDVPQRKLSSGPIIILD